MFPLAKDHLYNQFDSYISAKLHRQALYSATSLKLTGLLREHDGCVNTLDWAKPDGTWLLSGSDDTKVVLWDAANRQSQPEYARTGNLRHMAIATGHTQNIFDAKFIPSRTDCIVTAAGDGQVRIIERWSNSRNGTPRIMHLKACESNRAKRIEFVSQTDPNVFMVCTESGCLVQFDLRDSRRKPGTTILSLEDVQMSLYGLSICKHDSNVLAVCGSDPFVRFYDRRRIQATQPSKLWCAPSKYGGAFPTSASSFIADIRFSQHSYDLAVSVMLDAPYIINAPYGSERCLQVQCPTLKNDFSWETLLWSEVKQAFTHAQYSVAEAKCRQLILKHKIKNGALAWSRLLARELYNCALCKAHMGTVSVLSILKDLQRAESCDDTLAEVKYFKAMAMIFGGNLDGAIYYCDSIIHEICEKTRQVPFELERKLRSVSSLGMVCSLDPAQIGDLFPKSLKAVADSLWLLDIDAAELNDTGYLYRAAGPVLEQTIKNISFVGDSDQYLATGSDGGYAFLFANPSHFGQASNAHMPIWLGRSDGSVVNVIESHPRKPILAVSGIDDTIKLWEPEPIASKLLGKHQWVPEEPLLRQYYSSNRMGEELDGMARSQNELLINIDQLTFIEDLTIYF